MISQLLNHELYFMIFCLLFFLLSGSILAFSSGMNIGVTIRTDAFECIFPSGSDKLFSLLWHFHHIHAIDGKYAAELSIVIAVNVYCTLKLGFSNGKLQVFSSIEVKIPI